ncbi:hypothetical protein CVT26_009132 [Gymnopilus dilepis]|uniref:Aminoglycoside phosphotransferase domain-containing protein n=1 Tax=Gymnopilus dilepis TaxID=231916 RepID=A0A409YRH6_9AGAR|nr:hypothetical protein CVT26_009132 [Gymnopilus dilepis]
MAHNDGVSDASSRPASPYPAFVESMDLQIITTLASVARQRLTSLNVQCTVDPNPKIGAFNAVWFINFSDGMHWVLRTPLIDWSPILEKRLHSDMIAMKLIQSRTEIPIPAIHDFSYARENALGRPYTLMDRAKGTQLCKVWFDPIWFTEKRRMNVFRSLVSCMSQLRTIEFDKIGSVDYDSESCRHFIGPLLPSLDHIAEGETTSTGPYDTVHAYLFDQISRQIRSAPTEDHKVSLALLRMFAGSLPDESLDSPPFVLSMPDFNYQNIFVDEDGEVTALIDWDGIMVGPRQGGYARYPSWITRDWDPLMYGYPDSDDPPSKDEVFDESSQRLGAPESSEIKQIPPREVLEEDSPSTLQSYRDEYLSAVTAIDPESAFYTRNSHIFEAVEIAVFSPYSRGHILDRLARHVFGMEAGIGDLSCWGLEQGIRAGDWLKQLD